MGGRPVTCLNLVAFPSKKLAPEILHRIVAGAQLLEGGVQGQRQVVAPSGVGRDVGQRPAVAALDLGEHRLEFLVSRKQVVAERHQTLEAAIEENPYRERLWHLLVQALARQGRRVEALRACAELRRLLVEVGLEPGVEVTRLEEQILLGESV